MGVLDGGGDRQRGRGSFGVNVGHPIVATGDGDVLSPNYFGGLVISIHTLCLQTLQFSNLDLAYLGDSGSLFFLNVFCSAIPVK